MMKRIFMLMALALMVGAAMALSGVAQAKTTIGDSSPEAQCAKLATQTLGKGFNPSNYTFFGGTAGDDNFNFKGTAGADVFCGFGGNDSRDTLDAADIFLGGAGNDQVDSGDGSVTPNNGTFYGGDGNDFVFINNGTFYGGAGVDQVYHNRVTFNGEAGNDFVFINNEAGTFNGGADNDSVTYNNATFNGGAGLDTVSYNYGGSTFVQ